MRLLRCLACSVVLLCFGCEKNSPPPATNSTATNAGVAAETSDATALAELSQVLRKFSAEQRRVPASLDELVAAGYLSSLPQPSSGKAFGIDSKNLKVILK